jgi:hypothetical protein
MSIDFNTEEFFQESPGNIDKKTSFINGQVRTGCSLVLCALLILNMWFLLKNLDKSREGSPVRIECSSSDMAELRRSSNLLESLRPVHKKSTT